MPPQKGWKAEWWKANCSLKESMPGNPPALSLCVPKHPPRRLQKLEISIPPRAVLSLSVFFVLYLLHWEKTPLAPSNERDAFLENVACLPSHPLTP
jgi:hypothetical protein